MGWNSFKTSSSVVLVPSSVALDNSFIWQRNLLKKRSLLLFRRWFIFLSSPSRNKISSSSNEIDVKTEQLPSNLDRFRYATVLISSRQYLLESAPHTHELSRERGNVCVWVKEAGRGCVCRGARHTSAAMLVCKARPACVPIKNRNLYFSVFTFWLKIHFWLINYLIYNLSYYFSNCLRLHISVILYTYSSV